MISSFMSEEFVGRFGISYKDGKIIYVYDEITHGLYKFTFEQRQVMLVLSPYNIHRNTSDRIQGISKIGNELILIPSHLNSEWVFYDVKKSRIRYASPVSDKVSISDAITIKRNLFLIPSDIYNPIILISLDNMRQVKKFDNWYIQNTEKIKIGVSIWGAHSLGNQIVFPIINSNCIGYLNTEKANTISLNVECQILSASMSENRIWVLPTSGEYIYAANFKGEITDTVNLFETNHPVLASDFIRIVVIDRSVFLFPVYRKNIFVYQIDEKKLVEIKTKVRPLWGSLFAQDLIPFWNFIIENKRLHLLPCDYQYETINISSLKSDNYSLYYKDNISEYWRLIEYKWKDQIFREKEDNIEQFLLFLMHFQSNYGKKQEEKIGKQIWTQFSKNRIIDREIE